MKTQHNILFVMLSFLLFGLLSLIKSGWAGTTAEYSIYATLLEKYVKQGQVDYRGFKSEEAKLDQYLIVLEKTDSKNLSRNEQSLFMLMRITPGPSS